MTTNTLPTAQAAGTLKLGDLTVNRLGYGAMRLTGPGIWGEPADREGAKAVLKRAVELGVNLIDTAETYGPSVANRLIAETLFPYPKDLIIVSKLGAKRGEDKSWQSDFRPERIRATCETNLQRLKLDHLDLVHFRHFDAGDVPFAESFGAMADLQREGKIRHLGLSSVGVEQLAEGQSIATIVSVENLYNVSDRHSEAVLEACAAQNIPFLPYFPLAMGKLGQADGVIATIAQAHGVSTGQVAIAWLLMHSPVMLPIPGTSSVAHLEDNIGAASLQLSEAEYNALNVLAAA
ncbi:MAG: aldo/keto reductase [Anaerolineae bacterium]|nr:aldo/keto reductase [Anaerolineae bacterium]